MVMVMGWEGGGIGCVACEEVSGIGKVQEGSEGCGKGIGCQVTEIGGGERHRGFR